MPECSICMEDEFSRDVFKDAGSKDNNCLGSHCSICKQHFLFREHEKILGCNECWKLFCSEKCGKNMIKVDNIRVKCSKSMGKCVKKIFKKMK